MIPRLLNLPFGKRSFFLFGPRQVGKSTMVKNALRDREYVEINLLKSDILLKYKKNHELLRHEVGFLAQKICR